MARCSLRGDLEGKSLIERCVRENGTLSCLKGRLVAYRSECKGWNALLPNWAIFADPKSCIRGWDLCPIEHQEERAMMLVEPPEKEGIGAIGMTSPRPSSCSQLQTPHSLEWETDCLIDCAAV